MKNKFILAVSCLFSLIFLGYIFKLADEIQHDEVRLEMSPNIKDVTNKIKTKILVTKEDLPAETWGTANYNGLKWNEIKIPSHSIITDKEYAPGSYVYYSIYVPKEETDTLSHLKGQLELALGGVFISKAEVFVNGSFLRLNTPETYMQSNLNIPVEIGRDNVIGIKGYIKDGDRGIYHRKHIYLGKASELYSLYSFSYRGDTVFPLIFVLCKGSVIFVFTLIFLLLNVGKFFEKSLLFSLCAVGEDILTGDFLTNLLNLNIRAYLHNLFCTGGAIFLFLFLGDVISKPVKKKHALIGSLALAFVSFSMMSELLYRGLIFNFDIYLKFWIIIFVSIQVYYLPKILKVDKVLFSVIATSVALTLWSSLLVDNIGLNLKLFANLLLFFMVAYQSFALFRKEQIKLQDQEIQLLEQEKDVAIGKTASLLAHDVRRPLEQMKLILEKVSKGEISEEFLKAARTDVNFSITSVNNQINDIMNYSKSRQAELSEISFYHVLSGSLKQIMTINKGMNISLVYDFKSNNKIQGDESRLSSALTNLISNAVEAIRDIGKKQNGMIRLTTHIQNNQFIFRIFNDGPPIPEKMLTEIWKPLFTHGKESGTGLGLSSVMKTINDHKGSISVHNVEGKGVEFEIILQAASTKEEPSQYQFHSTSKDYSYEVKKTSQSDKRLLRIFLLDDDMQVEEYFKFLIQNLPFQVEFTFASHFDTAKTLVQSKRFDLYILDYDLGDSRTGLDFYHECFHFLSNEVVIHSGRDEGIVKGENCGHHKKPMIFDELSTLCENVYTNRLKILLVDDSELTRMTWEMFHGRQNIELADSPEAALDILNAKKNIDLCVVDYYFDNSQMNGEKLALKIRELYPEMKVVLASNAELSVPGFKAIDKGHFDVRSLKA